MCDGGLILTSIAIAASVASGVTGYASASRAAYAQQEYQNQMATDQALYRNKVAEQANQAYLDKAYQENLRLQQEGEAASDESFLRKMEAEQARARARVSAGEAGVSGLSVDALLADYNRQEDYALQNLKTNQEYLRAQAKENIRGHRAEAISRVTGVRDYIPQPVQRPSLMGTIFETTANVAGIALASDLPGQISRYRERRREKKESG